MKNFVFNLEKLLEIRRYAERKKILELAEVTGRYMNIINSIEDLKKKKKDIMESRFRGHGSSTYSVMYDESLISAIDRKVFNFEKKLIPINVERENRRLEYLEAMKNKKVIENIKDKQAQEHKKKELLREEKAIDDIVSSY